MQADAGRLTGNADVLRAEREALLTNAAAIASRNAAMEKSIEVSKAAGVVNNSVTQSLTAKNNVLAQAVAKHEALAQNIVKVNSAASLMGGAMSAVGGFVKSMIFSLNGLIMVIMAAAYAWEYFSNKAKEAARNAKDAMQMADMLKRGKVQQENLDNAAAHQKIGDKEIAENQRNIDFLTGSNLKGNVELREKLIARNKELLATKKLAEDALTAGAKQVMQRAAAERAVDLNQMVDADVTKAMKPKLDEGVQLNLDFDKIVNPNDSQKKAHFAAVAKNQQETLAVKRDPGEPGNWLQEADH
ncbi:hypothetical protein LP414_27835 [Polaromonas sp. P1(28)-13]|nr:hypothetical protein LP414_27835 [Polaromonas sp. P1(28)-13]